MASGSGNPPVKSSRKESNGVAAPGDADLANAPAQGSGKSMEMTAGSRDTASHATPNPEIPEHTSQGDSSQVAGMMRATDSGTVQVVAPAIEPPMAGPQAAIPHEVEARGSSEAPAANAGGLPDVPSAVHLDGGSSEAMSGVHAAKLMQAMSGTEMRVGMQSSEFGEISIRTTVSQQQMVAQISLDHVGLSQAMSGRVSAVEAKLGSESGMPTRIEIHDQGTGQGSSFSSGSNHSSQSESRGSSGSAAFHGAAEATESDPGLTSVSRNMADDRNRLDVQA